MSKQSPEDAKEMERLAEAWLTKTVESRTGKGLFQIAFHDGWRAALDGPDVKELMDQLNIKIVGLREALKALRDIAVDHHDDRQRIRDAEQMLDQERARREILEKALEFECGNRCAHQNPCNAREALEQARKEIE